MELARENYDEMVEGEIDEVPTEEKMDSDCISVMYSLARKVSVTVFDSETHKGYCILLDEDDLKEFAQTIVSMFGKRKT